MCDRRKSAISKIAIFVIAILFVVPIKINAVTYEDLEVIIFYSTTCSSCRKLESFYDALEESYPKLVVTRYNIDDMDNASLLTKYEERYGVPEAERKIVPKVFIGNECLAGVDNIKQKLEYNIMYWEVKTIKVTQEENDFTKDIEEFSKYKFFSVLGAGLVNGINPCSISMILYFLSLVVISKKKIVSNGIAYCVGKFIAYSLMGTLLYGVLDKVNFDKFEVIIKGIFLLLIIVMIINNIRDYIAAKKENYGKINMQLPRIFRKFNHNVIKKTVENNHKILLVFSFLLGFVVSFGEFLCTGQIYLITMVTILHTENLFHTKALLYFIAYNFAVIVPLLIIILIMGKGKAVMEVSQLIKNNLKTIKIINIIVLILFGIFILVV